MQGNSTEDVNLWSPFCFFHSPFHIMCRFSFCLEEVDSYLPTTYSIQLLLTVVKAMLPYPLWLPYLECVHAQSLQLCPSLCDPMDRSLPGSSVHEIFQARVLKWIAMPSSRGSFWLRDRTWVPCITGGFFTAEPPGKPCLTLLNVIVISSNRVMAKKEIGMISLCKSLRRKYSEK